MPAPYYPGIVTTPNLGLSLSGQNDILAENFVRLDQDSGPFVGDFLVFPPYQGTRGSGIIQFAPATSKPIGTLAVMPYWVDRNITLTTGTMSLSHIGTAGTFYYFCIYTNGNLVTYLKFPLNTVSPTLTAPLSPSVTIHRGVHKFCVGSDDPDTLAVGNNYFFDSNLMNMLPGGGMSTNIISNGVPPATLGQVNEPWPYSAPYVCLY